MMYPSQMTGGNSSVLVKEPEIGEVLGKLKPNHACSCLNQSAMNDQSAMSEFHEQLRQLARETCQHPPGSLERRRGLTRLIREIQRSGKLWRENTPYYEDVLQETLIYFSENLCEGTTGKPYDPDQASPITFINFFLKKRLLDRYRYFTKKNNKEVDPYSPPDSETGEKTDLFETLPAPPDPPQGGEQAKKLEKIKHWVKTDPDGNLRRTCIQGYLGITCQVLIWRRMSLETRWKDLAEEFDVPQSTLSCFYQRKCIPCLREFDQSQQY